VESEILCLGRRTFVFANKTFHFVHKKQVVWAYDPVYSIVECAHRQSRTDRYIAAGLGSIGWFFG
jgi:hypothetical protein